MRLIVLAIFVLLSSLASAELYRWVDESGKVHFSDRPLTDSAESYEPPPLQIVPALPVPKKTVTKEKKAKKGYEEISIDSPKNAAIFTHDIKEIKVSISLTPALHTQYKHQTAIYYDGALKEKGNSLTYTLEGLVRGEHTLQAKVLDSKGKTLISSESVSFHVQRHHR